MSTTHLCLANMPLAAAHPEGHSPSDALSDDAIRQCRSISPNCSNSPIPRYERNMGFFRQLSRRFGLRSNDDLVFTSSNEDDNQSSSTDSCSSHAPAAAAIATSMTGDNNKKASEQTSCASSETSSTVDITEQIQRLQLQQQQHQHNIVNVDINDLENNLNESVGDNNDDAISPAYNKERKSLARSSFSRLHRRSTSSIRRAFETFSLSSRSLSCSGATPPPNLPTSPTSASPSSHTNNISSIKSAMKSSSNQELNKKSQSASLTRKFSICSASAAAVKTSSSSSSTAMSSKSKTKPPPQRILRQPVSYTYLKGISGLPTQRVPRSSVCCQYARR